MEKSEEKKQVFHVLCPCCQSIVWIDPITQEVIKFEKKRGKKESLEELLSREKKRQKEFERKFEATAELEKKKWKRAEEKFRKVLSEVEKED